MRIDFVPAGSLRAKATVIKGSVLMVRYTGHAVLLVLAAIFVFHSPFTHWWADLGLPWYTVFLFWFVLIALVALDNRKGRKSPEASNTDDARANRSPRSDGGANTRSSVTDTARENGVQ